MKFPSTRLTAVIAARSKDEGERRRGFESLVAAYWKPVYKFVRIKWSCSPDDAEDLTQGFFTRAIEKGLFAPYDARKGSFRTYLRTCLEGYVANEHKSATRLKRGGDQQLLSLDFASAEGELREHPPAPGLSPEDAFHREWVRSLFALALEDLRTLCGERGKLEQFRMFVRYDLEPDENTSYAALANDVGVPVTTVTNQLAWARREFRRALLDRLRAVTGGESDYRSDAKLLLGGGPL
jgi:RNA polymerase sigma factor (sigma-70 family)